jgi:hypothetical protein
MTYISENSKFIVPENSKQIFISMVAGGGRGGIGSVYEDMFISGGGGGAGGACSRLPFFSKGVVSFDCRVGQGGNEITLDGGNTEVDIYVNNVFTVTYSVKGGKHAEGKLGGVGGKGYYTFNGTDGENGNVSTTNNVTAGEGGSSIHFNGGIGMTNDMVDNSKTSGNWGSGGGGSLPFRDNIVGNGGNGFIFIEYI